MLSAHPNYVHLVDLARRCHQAGRNLKGIAPADIDLARLYSYAFRGHVIGAFHATKTLLLGLEVSDRLDRAQRDRAVEVLEDLADLAMDPVPADARVVISTFHRYDLGIRRALASMTSIALAVAIAVRFQQAMEEITTSNGICVTRDMGAPEQSSFIVPQLGITIVPLVYGDFHSWNLAVLPPRKSDVPCHRHQEGVEIHLGYSPMRGETILGDCRTLVAEGYAMPIPPGTAHGYVNASDWEHHVPFIYGSLKAGGWGVFLDVEPQSSSLESLKSVALDAPEMNGSIFLEGEIARAEAEQQSGRRIIIPAAATDCAGCGGLELAVARVAPDGLNYPLDGFRIVSVIRGNGELEMAGLRQAVGPRDHFGVPAGMTATLRQTGTDSLVALEAVLRHASDEEDRGSESAIGEELP